MKCLKTILLLIIIGSSSIPVSAQVTEKDKIQAPRELKVEKPRIFNNIPEKFTVNRIILDKFFTTDVSRISVPVKDGITLEGTIVDKIQQNPNVVNLTVRLNNYDSSVLHISRITDSDLSVSYIAMVINPKSGDVLLLKKEAGELYFSKEKHSLVAVE